SEDVPATHCSRFSDFDIELFKAGRHYRLYDKLGAHPMTHDGVAGLCFAVWAPNARSVSVVGNFNSWSRESHTMHPRWDHSGIWELFIPRLAPGEVYKYYVTSPGGYSAEKGDPYAVQWETPPRTATVACGLDYTWND